MLNKSSLFFLLVALTIWSCDQTKEKAQRDSLTLQFSQAADSADQSFDTMLKVETRKWFMVKRLADELEYFNLVDTSSISSLRQKLEEVKAIPYSPGSIAEEGLIDRYDAKTEEIINQVNGLHSQQQGWEKYSVLNDLYTEIKTLDERVIFMRMDYDRAAFRCNDLFKEMSSSGHEEFKASIAKGKRAVFQLGAPS